MPQYSVYKKKQVESLAEIALALHKEGRSLREVSKALKDQGIIKSHNWVRRNLIKLSTGKH